MRVRIVLRILGILMMLYSLSMLPPIAVSLYFSDGLYKAYLITFFTIFLLGILFWVPVYRDSQRLRTRDGFVVAMTYWIALGAVGALPFILVDQYALSVVDALFESISGITTTGATVFANVESLPKSIVYYRHQLQWLGGMGIIVLAVAVLSMLGIGGMQLYRAETPGAVKDQRIKPRIAETAKSLWYIYGALTLLCAGGYWLAGMNLFDAICHSFSTISIGGFSSYDASIGYFNNPYIECVGIFFMLVAAANFGLHFYAWQHRSIRDYLRDTEFRFFLIFVLANVALCAMLLLIYRTYTNPIDAIRYAAFDATSIISTTGFRSADFSVWPSSIIMLLMMGSFVGACAASTGGGMKVVRVMLIVQHAFREVKRLIHPSATFTIKIGAQPVDGRVLDAVWAFFAAYLFVFVVLFVLVLGSGLDIESSFSAVVACLNNLGPGVGAVLENYGELSVFSKAILCIAMIIGRLEIFTLLVVCSPIFWRS